MDSHRLLSDALLYPDGDRVPTPCFIIDKGALRTNLSLLREVQDRSGCKILLALKGFAAWSLAPLIREYLPGIAASSPHEARLGKEEFAGEVHTYSPAFSPEHFHEVVQYSDTILFNSFSQWQRHAAEVKASPRPIEVGIRVNPQHSEVQTALYDPCAPGSRLGVPRDQFRSELLDGVSGLHMHTLCELGADALERTIAAFEDQFSEFFPKLSWVNFGGGHHITKPGYEVDRLVALLHSFREKHGLQVILEPGEAIAIHTGVLATKVLDIVHNGDLSIAILDTSATAHMPDVLEMPYRPDIVGAGLPEEKEHRYRLGGISCLAGDVIGDYSFAQPLQVGQILSFLDMSHYSMVKTSTFNGVQLPSIATYAPETDDMVIVKRFGYDSYKSRLS